MHNHEKRKISVVSMMTDGADLKTEKRAWRRSIPAARAAILEHRVYLNDRLVTHTNTSIVSELGTVYMIKVWSLNDASWDYLEVTDHESIASI